MARYSFVKRYFRKAGTVSSWWNKEFVEKGNNQRLYERDWEIIKKLFSNEQKEIALEVSCGYGRLTKNLSCLFKELVAIDISKEMLKMAQGLELKNVEFVKADAEALPFKDNKFDCTVCVKSFVHYPNPERALAQFFRVLKPNGVLIIDVDNKFSLRRILKDFANVVSKVTFEDFTVIGKDIFFPYSKSNFFRLIRSAGFSIEEVAFVHIFPPINIPLGKKKLPIISPNISEKLDKLGRFLERFPLSREFATYIFAKCRKPKKVL